ncbi:MAG: hypothetical protein NPIRA02_29620 [Nitrospirales bacterium]|nr:MAG: hypothetical protein NPIRA02_29620 [Nitrospirales bacterium]
MKSFLAFFVMCLVAAPVFAQTVVGPNVSLSNDEVNDSRVTKHCYYKSSVPGQYSIGQYVNCAPLNVVNGVNRQSISILNAMPDEVGYTVITSADDAGNESEVSNELHFQMQSAPLERPSGLRFEVVTPVN